MKHLGLNGIHSDQPKPFILPTQTRDTKVHMAHSINGRTDPGAQISGLSFPETGLILQAESWEVGEQREDSCLNTSPGEYLDKCQEWGFLWAISSGWALSFQAKAKATGPPRLNSGWRRQVPVPHHVFALYSCLTHWNLAVAQRTFCFFGCPCVYTRNQGWRWVSTWRKR